MAVPDIRLILKNIEDMNAVMLAYDSITEND